MIQNFKCPVKTSKGPGVVTVQQIPAMRSGKLLVSLMGSLGPGLGAIAVASQKSGGESAEAFVSAIKGLAANVTPAEFERVSGELLEACTVKVGGEETILEGRVDELFTGHIGELFRLLGFALKANYADFFDGALGGVVAKLSAKIGINKPSASPTPSGSSGPQQG